jgi:aspartyl/asparaginyl beta-hydroxylase (cupin superfamily)/thioredoxin-like negative regulator of GroEL
LSKVNVAASDDTTVLRILQASKAAGAAGRTGEADQLLAQVSQIAPNHPAVLNELGLRMMLRSDPAKARELFARAAQVDPKSPALWSNLASALHELGRADDEMEAIERALSLEPRHLGALLQKGMLIEARGDGRNAARAFRNALATVPSGAQPPPTLAAALAHAREVVAHDDQELATTLEARLVGIRAQHGGGAQRRLDKALQLLTGKARRYHPEPTFLYFPGLPAVEFFERGQFPWLDAIEAAADEIRQELTGALVADRAGLEPYVAYPEGVPLNQWQELNKSRRWSAYFLWNQGVAQEAHMARCPRTVEVLRGAPQCDVPRRGPTAFFSILDAHTHIPAHCGITNTRLTVHLPLIVPPQCRFRVGSETRDWEPGKAWVFDDTIEHEAWNDSDTPRAILIFDVWNPFLSDAERDLVRAAVETVGTYYGVSGDGAL